MQKYLVAVLSVVVLCLIAAGCAKPPTEEMEAAKTAVRAARDEGAPMYAAAEFEEATKALADAETRVATKKYDEARSFALQAKQKAEQAKESAVGNKAAAKAEAEASIAGAGTALSAATDALASASLTPSVSSLDFPRSASSLIPRIPWLSWLRNLTLPWNLPVASRALEMASPSSSTSGTASAIAESILSPEAPAREASMSTTFK